MALEKKNTKKWITALRSGKYAQVKGACRRGSSHDAIGVACEVFHKATGLGEWVNIGSSDDEEFLCGKRNSKVMYLVPSVVADFYGLEDALTVQVKYKGKMVSLVDLNDYYSLTFAQIADVLEKNLL